MPRNISHIVVGIVYHPPNANSWEMTSHIIDSVDKVLQQHPYAGVVILGDFNTMNDRALCEYPLKQVVMRATRGTALLDKIYTTIADYYLKPISLPSIGSSDHNSVLYQPAVESFKNNDHQINVKLRSNDTNGKNLLAHALVNQNWNELYNITSVDTMLDYFNSHIMTMLNTFLPVRTVKRHTADKPWISDEFRRLIRSRQYAWTTGNLDKYRRLRNHINRLSKQLRQQYYNKQSTNLRNCEPARWWRDTKRLIGQSTKPNLISLANDCTDGDINILAERINESLTKVSSDLTPISTNDQKSTELVPDEYKVQPYEVFNKLSNINIRKSPGPDEIPNWFLRDFAFAISEPISHIFNRSICTGIVPKLWKTAYVVPVPKVCPPKSVENDLRPISLTPTLSKLLESIIGRHMLYQISSKFEDKQFGGLKGRSTTHAIANILHKCHQSVDKNMPVRSLFIDYSKAFEHVDHNIVLNKLTILDAHPAIIAWIRSFLHDRQQRVKIGNVLSNWSTLNGGMPQGTWLGVYIFIIHINDLKSSEMLYKFVDDITALETIDDKKISHMQTVADEIIYWSTDNLMTINHKKTKEMIFDFSIDKLSLPPIIIDGNNIEQVSKFKLLGVTINNKLNWDDHVTAICTKASKRLYFLKLLKRSSLSTADLIHYYRTVIRTVIEYACPVWQSGLTDEQRKRLEYIQRRAITIISGSKEDYESYCSMHSIEPINVRLDILCKKIFVKICKPNDCLYNMLPNERDITITQRLRQARTYPTLMGRTERFIKSFLPYALSHYQ